MTLRRMIVLVLVAAAAVLIATRVDFDEAIEEFTLPLKHEDIIRQQAGRFDLDPALVAAIINQESEFDSAATSPAGALGLMQITRDTGDQIEKLSGGETFVYEDLSDPDLNVRYGTFYFRHLLDRFGGNEVAALAAYNAGPENVVAWGGSDLVVDDIEFAETRAYVENVLDSRDAYRDNRADELGL